MASSNQGSQGTNDNTSSGSGESSRAATQPKVGSPTVSVSGRVQRSLGEIRRELWRLVKKYEPLTNFNEYSSNVLDKIFEFDDVHKAINEAYKEICERDSYSKGVTEEETQLIQRGIYQMPLLFGGTDFQWVWDDADRLLRDDADKLLRDDADKLLRDDADATDGKADASDEKVQTVNRKNEDDWEVLWAASELVGYKTYYPTDFAR